MEAVNPSNIKALSDAVGPAVMAAIALIGFVTVAVYWVMKNTPQHTDESKDATDIFKELHRQNEKIDTLSDCVSELKSQLMVRNEHDRMSEKDSDAMKSNISSLSDRVSRLEGKSYRAS